MERLAGPDEGVRTELARLNAELEQALVAVEDAQKEVTLLARQRDALIEFLVAGQQCVVGDLQLLGECLGFLEGNAEFFVPR